MKALIYHEFKGDLQIEHVKDPTPSSHGVILKVTATGLCRSDWHGWMGHDEITLPHVPGHELAGEIVELGKDVQNFEIGQRVTVPFVCGCGRCEQCTEGHQQVCDYQTQPGFTHWGSFAEYVAIHNADINLVPLPQEITDHAAALLGCRFITSYRGIVTQGGLQPSMKVAVHGCGGVGLSAIMIAKAIGAEVIAIDINQNALEKAKQIGADHLVKVTDNQLVIDEIKSISNGGVHISVDAIGNKYVCENSLMSLRKRGKHIQIGLMVGEHAYPPIPMDIVIAKELQIIGSHGMQAHQYPEMLNWITEGKMNPLEMVSKTVSLDKSGDYLTNMDKNEMSGVVVIDSF